MKYFNLKGTGGSALLIVLALGMEASARDPIDLSASKRTEDQRKGAKQDAGRGSTQISEKAVFYEISYTARTTSLPSTAMAEWMVLVENPNGTARVAAKGAEQVDLVFGRKLLLSTDSVDVQAVKVDAPGRRLDRKIEHKIAGLAVRFLGEHEEVLFESTFPGSLAKEIDWAPEKQAQPGIPAKDLKPKVRSKRPLRVR